MIKNSSIGLDILVHYMKTWWLGEDGVMGSKSSRDYLLNLEVHDNGVVTFGKQQHKQQQKQQQHQQQQQQWSQEVPIRLC